MKKFVITCDSSTDGGYQNLNKMGITLSHILSILLINVFMMRMMNVKLNYFMNQ